MHCRYCKVRVYWAIITSGVEDPGEPLPTGTEPGVFTVTQRKVLVSLTGKVRCGNRPKQIKKRKKR